MADPPIQARDSARREALNQTSLEYRKGRGERCKAVMGREPVNHARQNTNGVAGISRIKT